MDILRYCFKLRKPVDCISYMKTYHMMLKAILIFIYILGLFCIYLNDGNFEEAARSPYLVFLSCENALIIFLHTYAMITGLFFENSVSILICVESLHCGLHLSIFFMGLLILSDYPRCEDETFFVCETPLIIFLKLVPLFSVALQQLALFLAYIELPSKLKPLPRTAPPLVRKYHLRRKRDGKNNKESEIIPPIQNANDHSLKQNANDHNNSYKDDEERPLINQDEYEHIDEKSTL